ncbi:MAG: hypothetical protein HC808_12625 [Candidatus Competibacteraceae bacterium]|nr:hypothetical protein [Candidatus Competibacteraceae bacterium]
MLCSWFVNFVPMGRERPITWKNLIALATAFKQPEFVRMLAQLAERFPDLPHVADEVRLAVLAALVDAPPPQSTEFWERIFKQAPEKYAGLVLSGMLAIDPNRAIKLLPEMPDTELTGQAAALKFDLTWDDLQQKQRYPFVQSIQAMLSTVCSPRFAAPVQAWVNSMKKYPDGHRPQPITCPITCLVTVPIELIRRTELDEK